MNLARSSSAITASLAITTLRHRLPSFRAPRQTAMHINSAAIVTLTTLYLNGSLEVVFMRMPASRSYYLYQTRIDVQNMA